VCPLCSAMLPARQHNHLKSISQEMSHHLATLLLASSCLLFCCEGPTAQPAVLFFVQFSFYLLFDFL
jgi:hypothetical protein